jgi:DNA-binding response OmpR family regulator
VKVRVMAVDDEPLILGLLKAQLESMGCEVVVVGDSREALERLKEEKVDGLFVDLVMPYMDGFALTKEARLSKLNARVPIVMLTGMDDAKTMRKGFESGVDFFLGKPFTRERIYNLLRATRGPMIREKQRYTRLSYPTVVTCIWGSDSSKQFRSNSVDISEGGMMLTPNGGLSVGQEIEVAFSLPDISHTIRTAAKVVRDIPPSAIGIKFIKLIDRDERDLQNYISARLDE